MIICGKSIEDDRMIALHIKKGNLSQIEPLRKGLKVDKIDLNFYLAPGFFDPQVNGFGGIDFNGKDLTTEDVDHATRTISATGVTTFFPTLITAYEGIRDQTKQHAYILGMLGLKQICVLLNKIDLVNYSQNKFLELKEQVTDFLSQLNIHPTFILPISALSSMISDHINANIFWMDPVGYQKGEFLLFRCVTQDVPCGFKKIYKIFDPASEDTRRIHPWV